MDYSRCSTDELERLLTQKDGEAICELAERCLYGVRGGTVNVTRAFQLYHKAEKMNISKAYIGLGEMYRTGTGVMRNEQLAREYYQKANVVYPDNSSYSGNKSDGTNINTQRQYTNPQYDSNIAHHSVSGGANYGISGVQLHEKLNNAENERANENYIQAKQVCTEVIQTIENIRSGIVPYSDREDVEDILIEANWLMAYIAFNEQRYQEMENYLAKEGVIAVHPWGAYLAAISHKILQVPEIVLNQDLQTLITVSRNPHLSQQQRGDVCTMIADLLQDGYGKNLGATPQMAKGYFKEAMDCGNEYATEQYNKLK